MAASWLGEGLGSSFSFCMLCREKSSVDELASGTESSKALKSNIFFGGKIFKKENVWQFSFEKIYA